MKLKGSKEWIIAILFIAFAFLLASLFTGCSPSMYNTGYDKCTKGMSGYGPSPMGTNTKPKLRF